MKLRILEDGEYEKQLAEAIATTPPDQIAVNTEYGIHSDPERFKRESAGVEEIVISRSVLNAMKAMGFSEDDIVARLTKAMGKQQ